MREKLREINGVRARFRGRFSRFGQRTSGGYVKHMALLVCVTDAKGNEMTDHLWLNLTERVKALDLKPGDVIEFDARVRDYTKGYYDNRRRDYKLNNPTNFVKIGVHDDRGRGLLFPDAFQTKEVTR
ncbi:MAG TPA: hypothetical protein VF708_19755 [Pyrinomonadaceae bacterium]|jgi:hypothetical protein